MTRTSLRQKWALYLDLIRWNRPAGWLLLLWPTLVALWLAASGWPGWHLLAVFVLGTILMRSAGCCINDIADREFDRHVKRTEARPITTGRISVREALAVGIALALAAFTLVLSTNWLTIAWSLAALIVTIIYPFSKRYISMPQAVLGVAFSLGIPMAATAAQGHINWHITAPLIIANLFWVLAYDTEYAMVDRDDDLRIGMKTSAITLGRYDVAAVMLFYLAHWGLNNWVFWRFLPLQHTSQSTLLALASMGVLAQIIWHGWLIRSRSRATCFTAFTKNHWIGCFWFAAVAGVYALSSLV